jgi:hypothetical protein
MRFLLIALIFGFSVVGQATPEYSMARKHLGLNDDSSNYVVGMIHKIEQTDQYTYIQLKTKADDGKSELVWLATQRFEPEAGALARFIPNAPMMNFKSRLLKKTFEKIYFVSELEIAKSPAH